MAEPILVMNKSANQPIYESTKPQYTIVGCVVEMAETILLIDKLAYRPSYGSIKVYEELELETLA